MELRRIDHSLVKLYASRAAREHVSLSEGQTPTLWCGAFEDDRLVAFAGLLPLGARRFRFRGAYTLPAERGKGYGTSLLNWGVEMSGGHVEALALDPAIYDRLGFRRVKERRPGVWQVRLD